MNSISPGDHEARKEPTYQATAAFDEAQRRGGKLRTTQQKKQVRGSKSCSLTKGEERLVKEATSTHPRNAS